MQTQQPLTLGLEDGSAVAAAPYQLPAHGLQMPNRTAKVSVPSIINEMQRPIASGSAVSCCIILAEQIVFLYGFDRDSYSRQDQCPGTALLRGYLRLQVSEDVNIKAIQLKFLGHARTEWPRGTLPFKRDLFEKENLHTQVLTCFNATVNGGSDDEYGNQCIYTLKSDTANSSSVKLSPKMNNTQASLLSLLRVNHLTSQKIRHYFLQNAPSRKFDKDNNGGTLITKPKGYKVFCPGTYNYWFELPIDYRQIETTKVQYGSVKWELQAIVERAGIFKSAVHCIKEVVIVRLPNQMSQEMAEPICISHQWKNQVQYNAVILGKSFPIGSKIAVNVNLIPLDKVYVHRLQFFLKESTEYWTSDRRATRSVHSGKILLLEKVAGKPLDPVWRGSTLYTLHGGELPRRRGREARQSTWSRHTAPEPLPENLPSEPELGLGSIWGVTEIEANIQLPTCKMMAKNKDLHLHPDCSWKNVNVFHWIKIVMKISCLDPDNQSGSQRRDFELSMNSPLTILNCRATQANIYLPSYNEPVAQPHRYQAACGCPDTAMIAADPSLTLSYCGHGSVA